MKKTKKIGEWVDVRTGQKLGEKKTVQEERLADETKKRKKTIQEPVTTSWLMKRLGKKKRERMIATGKPPSCCPVHFAAAMLHQTHGKPKMAIQVVEAIISVEPFLAMKNKELYLFLGQSIVMLRMAIQNDAIASAEKSKPKPKLLNKDLN